MNYKHPLPTCLAILLVTACSEMQIPASLANLPKQIARTNPIGPNVLTQSDSAKLHQQIPNGADLKKLQILLKNRGYAVGVPDGIGGRKTRKAVSAFQRSQGLTANGVATYQLLQMLNGTLPSPTPVPGKLAETGGTDIANECLPTRGQKLTQLKNALFASLTNALEVDVSAYLAGICVPNDKERLARLYIFLVMEGVIHSRIATTKYFELLEVFEKAGIDVAVSKDAWRRSTDSLPGDVRAVAQNRLNGVSDLVDNSLQYDQYESLQEHLQQAYERIEASSPYKHKAKRLLSEVLAHSSSSTFYLVRSAFTIDKLSSYFGINVRDGISWAERAMIFVEQVSENYELALFLLSKQSDLSDMLIASTYNIRALTQDIKDIPRADSRKATLEVKKLKQQQGLKLDDMEIEFEKANAPKLAYRT